MNSKELIAFLAHQTGWSLEYIGNLSLSKFFILVNELSYQDQIRRYEQAYHFAKLFAIWCSSKNRRYRPEDFIGKEPQREKEVYLALTTERELKKLILGDGDEYEFSPLNVNVMEALEEEFNESWEKLVGSMRAKVLKSIIYYLLKPRYPDITKEKVGELLTAKVLVSVYETMADMGK